MRRPEMRLREVGSRDLAQFHDLDWARVLHLNQATCLACLAEGVASLL